MILILAAIQFVFCAAFAALSRWIESAAFATLGMFFLVTFFGIPSPKTASLEEISSPHPEDPMTAGDVTYIAKSGSYWLSSSLFYLSLFGLVYGASRYVPELPIQTLLGAILSVVSGVLLVLYGATWKKGIPQVALVFRINAVLLSGVSAVTLVHASVWPSQFVAWVFWSHVGLSAVALAVALLTDKFIDQKFLRFLLVWAAVFLWAFCTYGISLIWSGWEPAIITAGLFGGVCFWLSFFVHLPIGWPRISRLVGVVFTIVAHIFSIIFLWFVPLFSFLFLLAFGLMIFHGWLHHTYRNWVTFVLAVISGGILYVRGWVGIWDGYGFSVLALCTVGLPVVVILMTWLTKLRAVDAWVAQYAAFAVMAGYTYVGWNRFGFGVFEWSLLLMAASLAWYGAWTVGVRKK